MKTRVWMLIIMFIPIMMSCGKDNDSGGSSSSTVGTLATNGIQITQQEVAYSNATALVVTVTCSSTSSVNYTTMISSLQSYISSMQNTATVSYNSKTYTTEGHLYAAQVALQTLQYYSSYYSSYNYYNYGSTTTSCPASQLGQGASLLY